MEVGAGAAGAATVIVVDDGVATGSTAIAAIRSLRARGVGRVVLAAPVASSRAAGALRGIIDEMEASDAVA